MDCLLSFVLFALYEEECGLRCRLKRSRRAGQGGRKQARSSMISIGNLSFATMHPFALATRSASRMSAVATHFLR